MKYLRKFNSISEMETALASATIDILGLAYDAQGNPVLRVKKDSSPEPGMSIPFYVENITQQSETLTIAGYDWTEQDNYLEIPVEYSTDGTTWSSLGTTGETPLTRTLQPGDKVYLRATTNAWYEYQDEEEPYIEHGCTIFGVSKVGGNIMSLLYGSSFTGNETTFPSGSSCNFRNLFNDMNDEDGYNINLVSASELMLPATTLTESCYSDMFSNCTSLTTAPTLPATTLIDYCYFSMFYGCSSLTTAPALPATTLAESCYESMFQGCTSLTTAPVLPATTLVDGCYGGMFSGCTLLTTAPALPATTLAQSCYINMFQDCSSLTTAPALPATTLADWCYKGMFENCTSLTTAPVLSVTTLVDYCYNSMFSGCTSLTTAPTLPATTLADYCYFSMFYGCSSLTTTPALPATTLAQGCYGQMFGGCTSLTTAPVLPVTTLAQGCYDGMFRECAALTTAPELPATTLADYCYRDMFRSCANLNYIKCLATDISATECTENWTNGVSATGTFVKDASMSSWTRDVSGIPSGWTVQNATE